MESVRRDLTSHTDTDPVARWLRLLQPHPSDFTFDVYTLQDAPFSPLALPYEHKLSAVRLKSSHQPYFKHVALFRFPPSVRRRNTRAP
jgi:hypothetical protein